jgi:hypothetical protein
MTPTPQPATPNTTLLSPNPAGLPAALQSVLAQTLQMLDAEPEPAAAAAAAAAATPSAEQVQVQQAAGAARREAKEKEISR